MTAGAFVANETITGTLSQGAIAYGTLGYSDTNIYASFTSSVNSYNQLVVQNTNNGSSASANLIVSNNLGTSTTYFGEFGMNSSTFSGSGAFNAANTVYLDATTADLAIGTTTANAVHFVVNNSTTDSITISGSTGLVSFPGTGAITVPVGTTAQEPTGVTGMLRFNSTTSSFEGYNGSVWGSLGSGGGSSVPTGGGTDAVFYNNNNVVTTNYTIPASTVTGTGSISTTTLTLTSGGPYIVGMLITGTGVTAGTYISAVISSTVYTVTQSQTVASTTLTGTSNKNSGTFGPVVIANGVTVTVPTGSTWSVV